MRESASETGLPGAALIPTESAETSASLTVHGLRVRARTPSSTPPIVVAEMVVAAPASIPVALPVIRPLTSCRSGLNVRTAARERAVHGHVAQHDALGRRQRDERRPRRR